MHLISRRDVSRLFYEYKMFHAGRENIKTSQSNGCSDPDFVNNADITDIGKMDANIDDSDVNVEDLPTQKPHFLDYDAVPPSNIEQSFCGAPSALKSQGKQEPAAQDVPEKSENIKVDKQFERDGEISDYELSANGYTKKEFTQDDNTLHLDSGLRASLERPILRKNVFNKPKHFLDENPIPPDYMVQHELREHRSLDRNFERKQQSDVLSCSQMSSMLGERKSSLDRGGNFAASSEIRMSRERIKKQVPSYALSRFLSSPCPSMSKVGLSESVRLPTSAWTADSLENGYESTHCNEVDVDSLGPKVECVYSLLSMLGSNDPLDMSKKFLELSKTPETCTTLRRSGCVPLLVQMMHSADAEDNVRKYASMALHNVVHSNPDERAGRREAKVLRHLDQITEYCNFLKTLLQSGGEAIADDTDRHPLAAISSLMKVSFDEEHRHAMCALGALHTIPNLVHLDQAAHGPNNPEKITNEDKDDLTKSGSNLEQGCSSLRRYALMALTNLTFGDEKNKAQLCSQKSFMEALVAQLDSAPDDLLQVTASVLRNLSWRADSNMKAVLNEIGTVTALARAAMKNKNENTLKAILSALWNLSAHCSTNKAEFCAVDGALAFLVDMLTYEGPSKTLKIIENAGGILRNVSSHIAVRENYRQILRERNCLAILLQQLKSESLTVVSNSCGTLWNLSARCPEDQKFLWDNGAVPMLRSLIHSKHAMISEGSSSALKNLLNFRPTSHNHIQLDPIARSMGLKKLPTLNARKQRALEQELGSKVHSETCENLDVMVNVATNEIASKGSDDNASFDDRISHRKHPLSAPPSTNSGTMRLTRSSMLTKSESRDSIFSVKSDSVYENLLRSHSASDTTRVKIQPKLTNYNAQRMVYALKKNVDSNDDVEHPIDYSIKYNETSSSKINHEVKVKSNTSALQGTSRSATASGNSGLFSTYQETDLDQPTDFSLRYAENQTESETDALTVNRTIDSTAIIKAKSAITTEKSTTSNASNSGVLLVLEDTVKCYQTEDTPYVISNAASVTDLRQSVKFEGRESEGPIEIISNESSDKSRSQEHGIVVVEKCNSINHVNQIRKTNLPSTFPSGSYTPEKPINYCEEGTPGYFSRYDSLSSLDESPAANNQNTVNPTKIENNKDERKTPKSRVPHKTEGNESVMTLRKIEDETTSHSAVALSSNINSAQETPLMFSRHSSMDSLIEEDDDPALLCDDKSSVVSDFSRLASGVISPSEIPDSPTQSMPQSPRRNSDVACGHIAFTNTSDSVSSVNSRSHRHSGSNNNQTESRPLRSVFEDDLNMFHVENTPAQFSCATSLSNLSIADEAGPSPANDLIDEASRQPDDEITSGVENMSLQCNAISEGEEDSTTNNDDILLANCINMGMHRSPTNNMSKGQFDENIVHKQSNDNQTAFNEATKHYCTEDTPAFLSKVGSNSNLSAISICSSNNNLEKNEYNLLLENTEETGKTNHRRSLNLSDDVSSNASESGAGLNQSLDILQQCIRDGMKKKPSNRSSSSDMVSVKKNSEGNQLAMHQDPIGMMRRGGNALPRYLPVADEMSKYLVEDSPCNFSIVSGLSNLTVGSSLVGPAIELDETEGATKELATMENNVKDAEPRREERWKDDSLSSLSIESEDDTNLLSQAIAAGCNRPKSNLGFSSTSSTIGNKRSVSLSASQPIPIQHGISTAFSTSRDLNRNEQSSRQLYDSDSDSNDNQSKSLLELCILTGMHKTKENSHHRSNSRHRQTTHPRNNNVFHSREPLGSTIVNASTQSNPNFKRSKHSPKYHIRERERKDEKLLLECINTGISKKISGSASGFKQTSTTVGNFNIENRSLGIVGSECAMLNRMEPKNVRATSVAVIGVEEVALIKANTAITAAAASGVENHSSIEHQQQNKTQLKDIHDDITENQELLSADESPVSVYEKTIGIGFNGRINDNMSKSDNTNSDDSNESFIIETTVSLSPPQPVINSSSSVVIEKHKDPDLMLKSVERLTLEFVSSAEQLRILSLSEHTHREKRNDSISNNTWNEDTHPNDVSFPSVSVTAPVIDSLTCDDDANEDDDELATRADHKELHDFAEITPTNEEQPQPSLLSLIEDEVDIFAASMTPQLNSLDTETETLVNDVSLTIHGRELISEYPQNADIVESTSINFKLGGAVQTAAAAISEAGRQFNFGHSTAHGPLLSGMTNSILIANEARALAENLLKLNNEEDEDLTFSINSLDLDNIRPPSGMESLNVSGYYHEPMQNVMQLNSVQKYAPCSPKLPTKSPKFLRKALPAGLMARRALGQFTGSTESVNSSFNLLDIKPPSLMDELLDSMISVSSIQSEVVDCCESMATTVSVSNYETATGADLYGGRCYRENENEFDDNTITLHSCCELLPCDDEDRNDDEIENDNTANSAGTPLATDNENYTSAESTPQKSLNGTTPPERSDKRSITPKMRRKLTKDRYKTYTIAATNNQNSLPNATEQDEVLQIEIIETENYENVSARRRRLSKDRYRTQTIIYPAAQNGVTPSETQLSNEEAAYNSFTSTDDCLSDDMSSIRAMTKRFTHITDASPPNNIEVPAIDDYNSTECEQNSETESCHGENSHHSQSEANEPSKQTALTKAVTENTPKFLVKAVRGRKKAAYVSPYSMQYQRSNTAPVTRATHNKPSIGNTFLRKRNSNTSLPSKDSNTATKKKSITNEQSRLSTSPPALERQGTFVKDEPTLSSSDTPIVEAISPTSPNIKKSPKSNASSNQSSPKRCVSKLPMKRPGGASNSISPQLRGNVSRVSTIRKVSIPSRPQRSNSNTNIRASVALSTRISTTTPPSRSNSILNTNENYSTNAINQTQSRIASIWKRPNDAKSVKATTTTAALKKLPTSNMKTQQTKSSTTLNTQKEQQQLIRSTTFDTSPVKAVIQKTTGSKIAPATGMTVKSTRPSQRTSSTKLAVHKNMAFNPTRNANSLSRK